MRADVQDEAIYRCINPTCARAMPRPVNFCPWCGTAQTAGARAQADERNAAEERDNQRDAQRAALAAAAAAAGATAAASLSGWADAPEAEASAPPPPSPPSPPPAPKAPEPPPAPKPPPPPPSPHAFGRSGTASPGGGMPPPPRPGVTGGRSAPRQREPIRLRWWIIALAILWAVWLVAKPSAKKAERHSEAAIALARECKAKEAQDELIALRAARATPAQLERVQKALNEEAGKCTRRRQKDKAWTEAQDAADAALRAGNPERARLRLQAYVKRWGEDADTRALRGRIDDARREHPLAVP
nr:hypothetical protein [uncultured Massilia sp.]